MPFVPNQVVSVSEGDTVEHFFKQFVEFRNWGWNATTVSCIGTLIFGWIFGWGLWQQIRKIRDLDSGKSIPIEMNAYFAYHFFAFSVYGMRIGSLSIILNGVFGFLFWRIYRDAADKPDREGKTKWEYLFVMLPLAMTIMPNPKVFMALMFISSSVFLIQAPLDIRRKRDSGSVEPKMVGCFIASACFWTVFSACIREWPLFAANVFGIMVMVYTLGLWVEYSRPQLPSQAKTHGTS